jgi:hypothetical protein
MKNKKSQIQTQIFVYVLATIIIGAILLYGYRSIFMMREKGEQIDLISFKSEVQEEIIKMSNDYGSSRILKFRTPSSFQEVCFIDLSKNPNPEIKTDHPLVYESWSDQTSNLFLIDELAKEFLLVQQNEIPLIEIDGKGYLCLPTLNNNIEVRLEGIGGKAKLSKIEN